MPAPHQSEQKKSVVALMLEGPIDLAKNVTVSSAKVAGFELLVDTVTTQRDDLPEQHLIRFLCHSEPVPFT